MAVDLAKLVIKMEADSAKLRADLVKSQARIEKFSRKSARSVVSLRKVFVGLTAGLSLAAFTSSIKSAIDFGDKVQKLSIRLGASTEALSELRHVADLSGVSFQNLTLGFQRMTRRVAEAARGTGEARGALRELGLDAKILSTLKPEDQFEAIADAIQGVATESDRVRLAMKLFDSEGVALLQTMTRGAAGIREMRAEAKRLGLTISQGVADQMAEANDNVTRLRASWEGLTVTLAASFAGTLSNVVKWISESVVPSFRLWAEEIFGVRRELKLLTANEIEVKLQKLLDQRDRLREPAPVRFGKGYERAQEEELKGVNAQIEALRKRKKELESIPAARPGSANKPAGLIIPRETVDTVKDAERAVEALDKAWQHEISQADAGLQVWNDTRTAAEKLQLEFKRLNALLNADAIDEETYQRAVKNAQDEFDKAKKESEKLEGAAKDLGYTFQSAFEDAVLEGENLRSVLKGLAQDIARIALRKAVSEPIGDFFGGVFGGYFADGGRPPMGRVSVVGERGPELFVPDSAGTIVPLSNGGGGGGVVINQYITGISDNLRDEIRRAALDGAQGGYNLVSRDFQRNGPLRKAVR